MIITDCIIKITTLYHIYDAVHEVLPQSPTVFKGTQDGIVHEVEKWSRTNGTRGKGDQIGGAAAKRKSAYKSHKDAGDQVADITLVVSWSRGDWKSPVTPNGFLQYLNA